jgi:hypothetical protein
MADAGGPDFDENLAGTRALEVDVGDFKGLAGPEGNCGACLHD